MEFVECLANYALFDKNRALPSMSECRLEKKFNEGIITGILLQTLEN
jgi:hypothetical protein